jgi:hypothetical protein
MTAIYQSAELRWFLAGHQHENALITWFTRSGELPLVKEDEAYTPQPGADPFVKQERQRFDEYLRLADCDTVGVKLREEQRLEVKSLVAVPRPCPFSQATGRVDQWVRWSLKPSAAIVETLKADLLKSGPWTKVVKNRYTQKYAMDSGKCAAVSPDAWPVAGCNVEMTLLNVEAHVDAWITFGFEAFGRPAHVMALLDEAVRYFFAAHGAPPIQLAGRDSLSYPAWLAMLAPRRVGPQV